MSSQGSPCSLCQKIADYHQRHADELVWEFATSMVFLGPWQYYEGYCVVTAKSHFTELFEVCPQDRHTLMDEVALTAKAIHAVVKPRKINYEWLGNQVPHLHWHLFPRQQSDPNHLQAVWLDIAKAEADAELKKRWQSSIRGRTAIIKALKEQIQKLVGSA